jgi:hypothetical protein
MSAAALGERQRWLSRLITAPEGIPAALADADGSALGALVRGDGAATVEDRLAVYAHAYFSRLHDCLRDDHPALVRALGAEAFHDLVKTYLLCHPPRHPSLRHAGARLAEHLETPPFAAIFSRRCRWTADLARFEWALVEAFDAPDAAVLDAAALATQPPARWPALRFTTVPSLRLLRCAWPVHEARAHADLADDGEAPQLAPAPTALCVWRRDETVRYRALEPLEADALASLAAGLPFEALCAPLAAALGDDEAPARAAGLLSGWIDAGLLAGPA